LGFIENIEKSLALTVTVQQSAPGEFREKKVHQVTGGICLVVTGTWLDYDFPYGNDWECHFIPTVTHSDFSEG